MTVVVLWMRPIGGLGGGFLADRFGKSRVLSIAMTVPAAVLVLLSLIPTGLANMWLIFATVVFAGLVMYVIRGVYWSLLEDCRVPVAATGIAIGVISFVGYLPDIFLPKIGEFIYDHIGDDVAAANNVLVVVVAGFGLVGAATAAYFATRMSRLHQVEQWASAVLV